MNEQVAQQAASPAPCIGKPIDDEYHYWVLAHKPYSIPEDFEQCMGCGAINASAYGNQRELEGRIDELKRIDPVQTLAVLTKNEENSSEWLNRRIAELQSQHLSDTQGETVKEGES